MTIEEKAGALPIQSARALAATLRQVATSLVVSDQLCHGLSRGLSRRLSQCRELTQNTKDMICRDAINLADMGCPDVALYRNEARDAKIVDNLMREVCSRYEAEILHLKGAIKDAIQTIEIHGGGEQ